MGTVTTKIRIVLDIAESERKIENLEDKKEQVKDEADDLDQQVEKAKEAITREELRLAATMMLVGKVGRMISRMGRWAQNVYVQFTGEMINAVAQTVMQMKIMATAYAAVNPIAAAILFGYAATLMVSKIQSLSNRAQAIFELNAMNEEIAGGAPFGFNIRSG